MFQIFGNLDICKRKRTDGKTDSKTDRKKDRQKDWCGLVLNCFELFKSYKWIGLDGLDWMDPT